MKKVKRITLAAKASKPKAPKKSPLKKAASKAGPKAASKPAKKPAPKKPVAKKPVAKKPAAKKPAPKAAKLKKTLVKAKKAAPVKKPAAKKSAGKSAKKEVAKAKPAAKQTKPAKSAKTAAAPSKPEKKSSVTQASKTVAPKVEPKRRGRPAKIVAGEEKGIKGEEGFMGEPDAEALAAVAAETEVKKPAKQPRRRRVRQPPRVPVTLRSRPAWAEAWTALAEAGFDAHTIPAVLRDASLMFIGLGELTPVNVESLFHFWEMAEVPAGIESTLEEAFLSQPQQADRKSSLEAFFKQALHDGTIQDTLILLGVARHFAEWADATKRLKVLHSPYASNPELYSLAREVVG